MTTTLTHPSAGAITLPSDFDWPDEFAWKQVEQATTYTTTGALIIEAYARQSGRPITLQGAQDRAWCQRGELQTLRAWASEAGQTFTLALRGQSHTVAFDHASGAITAAPIVDYSDPADSDPYAITLKFLEL